MNGVIDALWGVLIDSAGPFRRVRVAPQHSRQHTFARMAVFIHAAFVQLIYIDPCSRLFASILSTTSTAKIEWWHSKRPLASCAPKTHLNPHPVWPSNATGDVNASQKYAN